MRIPLSIFESLIIADDLLMYFCKHYYSNSGFTKRKAVKAKAQALIAHDRALHGREL